MGTSISYDFASLREQADDEEDESSPPEASPLAVSGKLESESVS
jgi:hypothetical protein